MINHQKAGKAFVCLAILITLATLAAAGCTESAAGQQGHMPIASEKQDEQSVATTIITMRTTIAPAQTAATQPVPAPVVPGAVITFDAVGEKKTGDSLLITGTTSLPAGTNLFWQIRQDTGKAPTGIDMDSRLGIMANNKVIKSDGTLGLVALAVDAKDTKDLAAGKYVALVVSLTGDPATVDPTTGTLAGYTYLTLK